MVYRITTKVTLEEEKKSILYKVIKLESETPLSVKQIKDQVFENIKNDLEKYEKKTEEVWTRGVPEDEANKDTDIFDKPYNFNPDYKLVVTEKKA